MYDDEYIKCFYFSPLNKLIILFLFAEALFHCLKAETYHDEWMERETAMMIIRNFYLLLYIFNKLYGMNYKHDNIEGLLNV